MAIVTRFPPSPTGYLHIGGARTAFFCWLFARRRQGRFILRIEDTDVERSTAESVQAILDGMAWLGLDYDEGPVYQSKRVDRYRQVIGQMLQARQAYHCYCTKDELEQMREQQRSRGGKPRYDGRCRDRREPRPGIDPVVRFKNPKAGSVVIDDLVKGRIVIRNDELDDLIIARSDGTPTYNFTVVVDDMDMGVTHVIRGDDHVNNTPRQINILAALGAQVPAYAHVPMIMGADGKRLSKRHGAVSVTQYRDEGYLPDALLNYLARLGWSHGDQEIFTREEMISLFDIREVHRNAAVFNPEKLLWLNYEYMKSADPGDLKEQGRRHFQAAGIAIDAQDNWEQVIRANQERSKTLVELVQRSAFFFRQPDGYDDKAVKKHFKGEAHAVLAALIQSLQSLADWEPAAIHDCVHSLAERLGLGLGKVAQPIRVAVAGVAVSPPIDETLAILGRDQTLSRLRAALDFIDQDNAGTVG